MIGKFNMLLVTATANKNKEKVILVEQKKKKKKYLRSHQQTCCSPSKIKRCEPNHFKMLKKDIHFAY